MALSRAELKNLASSLPVYFRGVDYFQQGRVQIVEQETAGGVHSATASVRGSDGYRVTVELSSDDGQLRHASCSCPAFAQYEGLCKHAVAVVIALLEEDEEPNPFSPRGALRKKSPPARSVTDPAVFQIMRDYARRSQALAVPGTAEEGIRIQAVLEIDEYPLRLSFKLGTSRLYILRDINKFCEAMNTGGEISYGKGLSFPHHPSRIREDCRPLLRFLLAQPAQYGYYGNMDWRRCIKLTPHMLDEFLRLFAPETGLSLLVNRDGETTECSLCGGPPELTLRLRRLSSGVLQLSLREDATLLQGLDSLYVLCGERICVCTEAYRDACERLLLALCRGGPGRRGKGLTLREQDLQSFYVGVLRDVAAYLPIDSRLDLSAYEPPPLSASIYLDQPSPGLVTAKLRFRYGETEYEGMRPRDLLASRDIRRETVVEETLKRYFPPPDPETGLLSIDGDEDALYRLISEGLEQLSALAELYVTDALRGVRVQPRSAASVGVRVNAGLLELTFELSGVDPAELAGVLASYRAARRYHRLRDGSFLNLDDAAVGELSELSEVLNLDARQLQRGKAAVPEYRALYLDALFKQSERMRYDRDNAFRRIVRDMRDVPDADFETPAPLKGVLRNYQKTGYRWLRTVASYGFGGILADDMGLGKTIQVLALLLGCREADAPRQAAGNRPLSLVVCPSSLILNWAGEAARFAPDLRVVPVYGTAPRREELLDEAQDADLIVTSYDLLKRDVELYQRFSFEFEILDEAQYIKNPSTQNAKAAKAVKSRVRFALTGTPVENSLSDLWSIYDYLMPGYLYSYAKFRKMLEAPIVREGETAASERLRKLVSPFILRRLKRDVLQELPEKVETVLTAEMTPEQRKLYLATALAAREQLAAKAAGENRIQILAQLTRLRQLCCDPALLYEDYDGGSGKLELCMELVRSSVDSGHKLLLFSQFTSMLAILSKRLEAEGIGYYELTGATPSAERLALADAFNGDGTPVFLISLKAGGTGLNLTGADVVIHYDPWWNLSAQNQATDRVHRIGQKNSVQVYRLIAQESIEGKIQVMQEEKARLSENVLQEGGGFLTEMTPEELLALFE